VKTEEINRARAHHLRAGVLSAYAAAGSNADTAVTVKQVLQQLSYPKKMTITQLK
jgi:hypothetical protein